MIFARFLTMIVGLLALATTIYGQLVVPTNLESLTFPSVFTTIATPSTTLVPSLESAIVATKDVLSSTNLTLHNRQFIPGYNDDPVNHTDCHRSDNEYIYFSTAFPNGTLRRDPTTNAYPLYFVTTGWWLTYPQTLRKSILNNATVSKDCPGGYCMSGVVPGTDMLHLVYIADPEPLRDGWYGTKCQYNDKVRIVRKSLITLGYIGYFVQGPRLSLQVLDFVEARIRSTYPRLEIGLMVGFKVPLIPFGCIVAVFFAVVLMLIGGGLCGLLADRWGGLEYDAGFDEVIIGIPVEDA